MLDEKDIAKLSLVDAVLHHSSSSLKQLRSSQTDSELANSNDMMDNARRDGLGDQGHKADESG